MPCRVKVGIQHLHPTAGSGPPPPHTHPRPPPKRPLPHTPRVLLNNPVSPSGGLVWFGSTPCLDDRADNQRNRPCTTRLSWVLPAVAVSRRAVLLTAPEPHIGTHGTEIPPCLCVGCARCWHAFGLGGGGEKQQYTPSHILHVNDFFKCHKKSTINNLFSQCLPIAHMECTRLCTHHIRTHLQNKDLSNWAGCMQLRMYYMSCREHKTMCLVRATSACMSGKYVSPHHVNTKRQCCTVTCCVYMSVVLPKR